MQKFIRNERGSSLVLVLLVVLVFTVMGLGLLGSTLTSAKQVNHTNRSILSTNLSEMGVDAVKLAITDTVEQHPDASLEQTIRIAQAALADNAAVAVDPSNPATTFAIRDLAVSGTKLVTKTGDLNGERLNVTFTSEGTASGMKQTTISATIHLTRDVTIVRAPGNGNGHGKPDETGRPDAPGHSNSNGHGKPDDADDKRPGNQDTIQRERWDASQLDVQADY